MHTSMLLLSLLSRFGQMKSSFQWLSLLQEFKAAIKREENDACIGYPEPREQREQKHTCMHYAESCPRKTKSQREQARPKVKV